ncbi:DUF7940 domain-containing protein [Roseibium aggregatum]
MKLVSDWRAVLQRAWSVRLMLLAALLSGAEVALPFLGDFFAAGLRDAADGTTKLKMATQGTGNERRSVSGICQRRRKRRRSGGCPGSASCARRRY